MKRPDLSSIPKTIARAREVPILKRLPLVGAEPEAAERALFQDRVLDAHVLTFDLQPGETAYLRRSSLIFASGMFHMATQRVASRRIPFLGLFSGQNLWANRFEAESAVQIIGGRDYHGQVIGLDVTEGESVWLQPALYLGHKGALDFTVRRVAKKEFWTLTEVRGEGTVYIKAPGRTFRQPLDPNVAVVADTNYVAAIRGRFSASGKVFTNAQYLRSGEAENVRLSGEGDVLIQTELPPETSGGGFIGGLLDLFI